MIRDVIPVLVEGDGDVPIARRLLEFVGFEIGTVYGLSGKNRVDERIEAYNEAARFAKWLVLRDLNGDAPCAPELLRHLLPDPSRGMCFRLAVRAAEAWLIADRQRIAAFLSVPAARVPPNPDQLKDPKSALVNLARRSRRKAIRTDMVPRRGLSSRVGPGYTARIIEYASDHWRPLEAADASPSLARALAAMQTWAAAEV